MINRTLHFVSAGTNFKWRLIFMVNCTAIHDEKLLTILVFQQKSQKDRWIHKKCPTHIVNVSCTIYITSLKHHHILSPNIQYITQSLYACWISQYLQDYFAILKSPYCIISIFYPCKYERTEQTEQVFEKEVQFFFFDQA